MVAACEAEGLAIPKTKTGKVSLAAGVCERFEDFTTIGRYSRYLTVRKTLSNDIELLRKGVEYPVQPRYDLADSGRTTCSKPNIQALNRGAGIRECFIPREGSVFIAADFSALELHTRAVWCLEVLGYSKLAETLNAGIDAHLQMAARMLNVPYAEAKTRKAEPFIKEARQRAKAINFGRPGGLGDAKFVQYAKASYGVTLSQEEAAQSKKDWLEDQPEVIDFFRLASEATSNPSGLAQETSLFTERTVGATRYSALCNRRFQGLGADAALQALWLVTRACYIDKASPLYGWHVVAFVHDEIICEGPEASAHEALGELEALMQRGANTYLSRVPAKTEGVCMRRWSKNAKLLRDATGRVIPWDVEVS
jgi:DNA polymerase I-like protein with 3'-5' exonuclease and polymerase domains